MLKKNQLVLILLTLVLMLSVFYIRYPFDKDNKDNSGEQNVGGDATLETGRLEELQSLRVILNEERAAQVLGLDAIIADSNKTVDEKNIALEEKHYINGLTEQELLLEVQIISKGYRDAFVHATSNGIEITVVANENTTTTANQIVVMALTSFNQEFDNVTVNFQTAEEVMGSINNDVTNKTTTE